MDDFMKHCPQCERSWVQESEQASSIDLFGKCIVCTKDTITKEEIESIMVEAKKRKDCTQ